MKIFEISDLHTEYWERDFWKRGESILETIGYSLEELKTADMFFICGDLNAPNFEYNTHLRHERFFDECLSFGKPVIFITGNHEYYHESIVEVDEYFSKLKERKLSNGFQQYENFYFLNNDFVDINGVRIFGSTLWTNLNNSVESFQSNQMNYAPEFFVAHKGMNDSRRIKIRPEEDLHKEIFDQLLADPSIDTEALLQEKIAKNHFDILYNLVLFSRGFKALVKAFRSKPKDSPFIVLSHHAPSFNAVPQNKLQFFKGTHFPFYLSSLEGWLEKYHVNPDYWFHGHYHFSNGEYQFDSPVLSTKIITNVYGYREKDTKFADNLATANESKLDINDKKFKQLTAFRPMLFELSFSETRDD